MINKIKSKFSFLIFDFLDLILCYFESICIFLGKHIKKFYFIFLVLFLIFFSRGASAYTYDVVQEDVPDEISTGLRPRIAFNFFPSKNNIIGIYLPGHTASTSFYVCRGVLSYATFSAGQTDCGGDVLIGYVATTTQISNVYLFGATYDLTPGQEYYIITYDDNIFNRINSNKYPANYLYGDSFDYSSFYDLAFSTIYYVPENIIDIITPVDGSTQASFDVAVKLRYEVSSSTLAMYDWIAISVLNKSASTSAIFNEIIKTIDEATILMTPDFPYYFEATTTIPNYGENIMIAGLLGAHSGSSSDEWVYIANSAESDYMIGENWSIAEEDICQNIATSTYIGQIECSLKKTGYWLFYPSKNSVDSIKNNFNDLKNSFPFNAFFDLTDIMESSIASTTTDMSGSFDVPMITATGTYYMLPVLSSSSVPNLIGQTNTNLIRNTISWIMWCMTAYIIFMTFKKI